MDKIKDSVKIIRKNGINFILDDKNRIIKKKPWLGDLFSFLYDKIMKNSVFPKRLSASFKEHYKILEKIYENIENKTILEFATGSGDIIKLLNNNNSYTGLDISPGLLRLAKRKLGKYAFDKFELYCVDALDTPFQNYSFDIAICNLSLNFFHNIERFISETSRILKEDGIFYCSVPVPERKNLKAEIHGTLYKIEDLKALFENNNFSFETLPFENGSLLYFKAVASRKK
ncbi:class I SAM-dependent methyltransferase [candidate division WOR-3 bacterium]|nr:class I SAM-dependent methyltransferase [candidate division WOR-3 bacterium]